MKVFWVGDNKQSILPHLDGGMVSDVEIVFPELGEFDSIGSRNSSRNRVYCKTV